MDAPLNLDNLLIQIRDEVTPHWYELGVSIGVPQDVMENWSEYPADQCIVEVVDYWLVHCHGQMTWERVADTMKDIKLNTLADAILQTHTCFDTPK